MPLPTINPDIAASIAHEMGQVEPPNLWIQQYVEKISKKNPIILNMLEQFARKLELDDKTVLWMIYAVMFTYRMLESQAECDDLTANIKLG